MSHPMRSLVLCLSVLTAPGALAMPAAPWTPAPGEYETAQGWGSLSVTTEEDGAPAFAIDAVGPDGQVCGLDGAIKGDKGYTGEELGAPCIISFAPAASGVSVTSDTPEACDEYCGTNAAFQGLYLLPPPECTPMERVKRRNDFKSRFRAKTYHRAYGELDAFYRQCGDFLNWLEIDSVRNDLALTQHYLGHDDECLATLKATKGAAYPSEEALRDSLPLHDYQAYLPVARVTWSTLNLCGEGGAAR